MIQDIKKKLKEKIAENIAVALLSLLSSVPVAVAFLFDHLGLRKIVEALGPVPLAKTILYLSGAYILLAAYAVYSRPKKLKFIPSGNLLWLKNDPLPFCELCYQNHNKQFHMEFRQVEKGSPYIDNFRHICPSCNNQVRHSEHPRGNKLKE